MKPEYSLYCDGWLVIKSFYLNELILFLARHKLSEGSIWEDGELVGSNHAESFKLKDMLRHQAGFPPTANAYKQFQYPRNN